MRQYIIITHAVLAQGFKSAVELIMGKQKHLVSYCAYMNPDEDVCAEALKNIENAEGEVIVITDLLGGSVNTAMMQALHKENVHIVSGANMLLVMQLLLLPEEGDTKTAIQDAIEQARQGMVYVNEITLPQEDEEL